MKLALSIVLFLSLLSVAGRAASALPTAETAGARETVKARALALLLGGSGDGPQRRAAISANDDWCSTYLAQPFVAVAADDGSGSPLNERLAARAGQLRRLAIAYRSDIGRYHRDPVIMERIVLSLPNVLEHFNPRTPRPGNWYFWLIRLPDDLGAAALLLQHELPPPLMASLREALSHQLTELLLNGANAAWEARNHTYLALLEDDSSRLERAARHVLGTVRYGTHDGVQEDYSYLFHGRIPYAGGYGAGFAQTVSQFIYLFDGTPWAASPARRDLVANFLLEHTRWFMMGGKVDFLIAGRSHDGVRRAWSMLTEATIAMAQVESARKSELTSTAAALLSAEPAVSLSIAGFADQLATAPGALPAGFRYWPNAEIGVFKGASFQVGFRQYSARVQDYEYLTQSGATGWNLAYGFTHIMRKDGLGSWHQSDSPGQAAGGLRPEIDMEHLPGATTQIGGNPVNPPGPYSTTGFSLNFGTSRFAGAAGWDQGGVAGFILEPAYSNFVARKSLHFFAHGFWALGSGIARTQNPANESRDPQPIHTTVLQWPAATTTPVLTLSGGRTISVPEEETRIPEVRWLWLEQIAAVFAEPAEIVVRRRGPVVTVWLDHGAEPVAASYAFAVLPDSSLAEAKDFADRLPVRPVRQDTNAHAVRDFSHGYDGMVFFAAGTCGDIAVDRPAIVYRGFGDAGGVYTVQDPLHEDALLTLQADSVGDITCPDQALTVQSSGAGRITLKARVVSGRLYRFGCGPAGRQASPPLRQDIEAFRAFHVSAESDASSSILTVTLPQGMKDAFVLSVHGDRGHLLATLHDREVIDRPAPQTVRYRWVRKPGTPNNVFPHTQQVHGDFRLSLKTAMVETVDFFTVPFFDDAGLLLPAGDSRRDRDNPARPRPVWTGAR